MKSKLHKNINLTLRFIVDAFGISDFMISFVVANLDQFYAPYVTKFLAAADFIQ